MINHRAKKNTVEVFQFIDTSLVHVKSISDTHFVSPNDLVAVSKNTFILPMIMIAMGVFPVGRTFLLLEQDN